MLTSRISVVVVLAGLVRVADAQPAAPAPPAPPAPVEQKGDAQELMALGVKLIKSHDYLGALAVFKDAYKRFPSAKILLNIGTTLKLLDRHAEAVNTYQRYLDSTDGEPARHQEVQDEIGRLEQGLARVEISAPPEAEVQVGAEDWVPAQVAKLFRVEPGPFSVRARRDGYKPFEFKGELAAGQVASVAVVLEKEPDPVTTPVYITVPGQAAAREPRSRLAALARGHFDVNGGAAVFVGAGFDITERIATNAAAIIGPNFGGFVSVNYSFLTGTLRPIASLGVPIFFNDGARVGVRGAGGLELVANRHFALTVELGVEYQFNPQQRVEFSGMLRQINSTAFIPAIGASARL